jgi:transposase
MAKDSRTKAKARRLYEYDGISQESIAEIVGVSRKSIENWMDKAAEEGDPWLKGRYSQEIREKEQAAKVKAIEDHGWNQGRVLAELGLIAGSDIAAYVDVREDGSVRLKDVTRLGELSRAIKSVKGRTTLRKGDKGKGILEDATLELVLHDKLGALTLIGKELGMFKTEAEKVMEAGIFAYYREQAAKRRGKT